MSLWKRGRQYWTDFTVNGRRYRKRLSTTNLRIATRREREMIEEARHGRLAVDEQDQSASPTRPTPTWLQRESGAHRARSSSRRSASASSRSTSATCLSPQ